MEKLEEKFEVFVKLQDEKSKSLDRTISTLWNNEIELDKSANKLDEQFAVLARMLFARFNELIHRVDGSNIIDEKSIEVAFKEWAEFRTRPDFRNLMLEWFLGVPLEQMPPPSELKKEDTPAESPDQVVEGPQEFGGDYAKGQSSGSGSETVEQSRPQDKEESTENALPERQDIDSSLPRREGPAMP